MRILVVADLHYSLPQYDWLLAEAPRYDLVIIAGDHIDLSSAVDGRAQILVISKYLDMLRENRYGYEVEPQDDGTFAITIWEHAAS